MSGRQRYNVPETINAITHDLHCICNEAYINSVTNGFILYCIQLAVYLPPYYRKYGRETDDFADGGSG
jgi:hypothetical protein